MPILPPSTAGHTGLEVRNLELRTARGRSVVDKVTFKVDAGEVFGLAGVVGNGQSELAEAIAGLRPVQNGAILVDNNVVTDLSIGCRKLKHRLAYVPAERSCSLLLESDVALNAVLREYRSNRFSFSM